VEVQASEGCRCAGDLVGDVVRRFDLDVGHVGAGQLHRADDLAEHALRAHVGVEIADHDDAALVESLPQAVPRLGVDARRRIESDDLGPDRPRDVPDHDVAHGMPPVASCHRSSPARSSAEVAVRRSSGCSGVDDDGRRLGII
jgi:hypothetical protein